MLRCNIAAAVVMAMTGTEAWAQTKLNGSGPAFPASLYQKWFKDYGARNKDVQIEYQAVGSVRAIQNFMDGTVDFAASDAVMSPAQIKHVKEKRGKDTVVLPLTAGMIVIACNLEGVKEIKLSREAYTGIFLGKITRWNHPAIVAANPGVSLPARNITVIVRSDMNYASFVFTKHLSAISPDFAKSIGTSTRPTWPSAMSKAKDNEGVVAAIQNTPGSIGYLDYGFGSSPKLTMATLQNKSGKYVKPSTAAAQAALVSADLPADLITWLPDPAGDQAYPIITYTWVLCYSKYADNQKANALKKLIDYCLTTGQKSSEKLGYVPLPAKVTARVKEAASKIQ